jgi:hypothetical protein
VFSSPTLFNVNLRRQRGGGKEHTRKNTIQSYLIKEDFKSFRCLPLRKPYKGGSLKGRKKKWITFQNKGEGCFKGTQDNLFEAKPRSNETHQRCVPGTGGACRELVQQEVWEKFQKMQKMSTNKKSARSPGSQTPPLADRVDGCKKPKGNA